MTKQFVERVTAFLAEAGIDCDVVPGENLVPINIAGITVNIGYFENRQAVVFQGVVGVIPESGRESFYAELLRMNSFFSGTQGTTLAIEDDAVTLQATVAFAPAGDPLSQAAFNAQAVSFLEAYTSVIGNFSAIAERAAAATSPAGLQDPLANLDTMLRI